MRRLEPFADDIRACLAAGWAEWRECGEAVPHLRVHWNPRTRASIIHNGMMNEVFKRFHNRDGVRFVRGKGGLVMVCFGETVTLRFKKLDQSFKTRNIRTAQTIRFALQLQMDGLMTPEVTNVVAGYLLNELQDEIKGLWIVCSYDSEVQWKHSLDDMLLPPPADLSNPVGDGPTPPKVISRTAPAAAEESNG